jgi:hypothetical protein
VRCPTCCHLLARYAELYESGEALLNVPLAERDRVYLSKQLGATEAILIAILTRPRCRRSFKHWFHCVTLRLSYRAVRSDWRRIAGAKHQALLSSLN